MEPADIQPGYDPVRKPAGQRDKQHEPKLLVHFCRVPPFLLQLRINGERPRHSQGGVDADIRPEKG